MIGEVALESFTVMIVPRYVPLSPSVHVSKIVDSCTHDYDLALFLATGTVI